MLQFFPLYYTTSLSLIYTAFSLEREFLRIELELVISKYVCYKLQVL